MTASVSTPSTPSTPAERDESGGHCRVGAGLLLYCIGHASAELPVEGRGVGGGALCRVAHGALAAVASSVADLQAAAPTAADRLLHEQVIHGQHAVADVLPIRFGRVLSDETAVRAHLHEQREAYLRALERVAGCVEMGVRALVTGPSPPAPPPTPAGRKPEASARGPSGDALKAAQRRHALESELRDRGEALQQRLLAAVATICREHRADFPPARRGSPAVYALYYLVPRADVGAFRAALSPLLCDGAKKLLLSGPWPPHHFI